MFGDDILANASLSDSPENLRNLSVSIACPESSDSLNLAAASRAFAAFMMAPPTMTIEAPALATSGAVSLLMPPAAATGMPTVPTTFFRSSSGEPPTICSSTPTWTQSRSTPILSSALARSTLSETLKRSTITFAPYFRAVSTASDMVGSDDSPRTTTTSAPDFAAISTSAPPTSMVFMSATIVFAGNVFFSSRMTSTPSLLMRGVPASIQSAPPSTASDAMVSALSEWTRSNAT